MGEERERVVAQVETEPMIEVDENRRRQSGMAQFAFQTLHMKRLKRRRLCQPSLRSDP
jgi:hypothetical protein